MSSFPLPQELIGTPLLFSDGFNITENITGDFSSNPHLFEYRTLPDHDTRVSRIAILIAGRRRPERDRYGGMRDPLPNGYSILVRSDKGEVVHNITPGGIKQNSDFLKHTTEVRTDHWLGREKDVSVLFRFDPHLYLAPGYTISILARDDFSDLNEHTFRIEGYQIHYP